MIGWKFFGRPIELVVLLTIFSLPQTVGKCPEDESRQAVNCEGQRLQIFPITQDPRTEALLLRGNGLKTINADVGIYGQLIYLDLGLQTEALTLKGRPFEKSDLLQVLKLDGNNLNGLSRNSFVGLKTLRFLTLNSTNVKDFIGEHLFRNLTNLQSLNLNKNDLNQFPRSFIDGLENLESLSVEHNGFENIPMLANLRKLKTLRLKGNSISQIDEGAFSGLSQLEELYLDDNPISTIEDGAFHELPNLRILSLRNTRLSGIPTFVFDNLPRLTSFDMSYTQIRVITRHDFSNMNSITRIDLHNCPHLRRIESNAFSNLPKLEILRLRHNQHLFHIDHDWLHLVPRLHLLNFRGCALKTLPQAGLNPAMVSKLYVGDNELECTCENTWIASLCRRLEFANFDCGARCSSPHAMRDMHLTDAIAEDCTPTKAGIRPGSTQTLYIVLMVTIPLVVLALLALGAYFMRNRLRVCCGKARASCLCKRSSFQSKQPLMNMSRWSKRDRSTTSVPQTVDPYSGEPPAFKVLAEYPVPITEL